MACSKTLKKFRMLGKAGCKADGVERHVGPDLVAVVRILAFILRKMGEPLNRNDIIVRTLYPRDQVRCGQSCSSSGFISASWVLYFLSLCLQRRVI